MNDFIVFENSDLQTEPSLRISHAHLEGKGADSCKVRVVEGQLAQSHHQLQELVERLRNCALVSEGRRREGRG